MNISQTNQSFCRSAHPALVFSFVVIFGNLLQVVYSYTYGEGSLFSRAFSLHYNSEESQAAIVISTLAFAALFIPLHRRLQVSIDRRFFRSKYDAEKTLAGFSSKLSEDVDLQDLYDHLVAVVKETFPLEHGSLFYPRAVSSDKVSRFIAEP